MSELIEPHGGSLRDLALPGDEATVQRERASACPGWNLTARQSCDIELLVTGACSPLAGFLGQHDYECVLEEMRLADGTLWPIPLTLDVTREFASRLDIGQDIVLQDVEGVPVAILTVESRWEPDLSAECRAVYGSEDRRHSGVDYLLGRMHPVYLGGRVRGLVAPKHYDFKHLRNTPRELRERFHKMGWRRVVAFHSRSVMHRLHLELTQRAVRRSEASLLINPVTGAGHDAGVDHFTRIRCYERVLRRYPEQTTLLSLLPMAPRFAGPREALWQAIVRKNYGCTHMVVGPNHGSPRSERQFFEPGAAQRVFDQYAGDIQVEPVCFDRLVFDTVRSSYVAVPNDSPALENDIATADIARRLAEDREVPEWVSPPEVLEELRKAFPPNRRRGLTVFLTGLSGAGKSTIANALLIKLMEIGGRRVTLLDGDVVRRHLSSELGFSREHRDLNILRIGFVASEITKNGGVAICAPIAPYAATRRQVRQMVEPLGGFIEVHVATPIELCERRDRKGLYAKARAGLVKGFTGIDDPYETPEEPEIRIDTSDASAEEAAQRIILKLEALGYVGIGR